MRWLITVLLLVACNGTLEREEWTPQECLKICPSGVMKVSWHECTCVPPPQMDLRRTADECKPEDNSCWLPHERLGQRIDRQLQNRVKKECLR